MFFLIFFLDKLNKKDYHKYVGVIMAKLTIRDIHQKMDEIKVIGKEGLFLWGAVKSMSGVQYLSKEYPMHGISYKNGYIYILPFSHERIFTQSMVRISITNIQNVTMGKEALSFGRRKTLTFNLKDGSSFSMSVQSIYLKQMQILTLINAKLN